MTRTIRLPPAGPAPLGPRPGRAAGRCPSAAILWGEFPISSTGAILHQDAQAGVPVFNSGLSFPAYSHGYEIVVVELDVPYHHIEVEHTGVHHITIDLWVPPQVA